MTNQHFSNREENLLQANNQQAVHMQAELPTLGTALNPVESEWAMNPQAAAMPADQTAIAMDQGE
ncbi:hypothetical protein [Brevibacillus sp. SYSU BS000544]|uniref:hypothetical protein n=1 Tax=Brevibacillus sp. SYSU BS000544 TaxID=3416443 RepID=UPI003CE5B388